MKDPILQSIYARIDIIDYVDGAFVKTASLVMLGDNTKYVKSMNDIKTSNKQLVANIGMDAVKALTTNSSIVGGNEWDDLDDLDFEELLNTETEHVIPASTSKDNIAKKIDKDIISNLILYSKDKPTDVREKIAVETNIKPYKQYLWSPTHYKSLSGDEISLMSHYQTSIRDIEGYPIDSHQELTPKPELPIDEYSDHGVVILYCISLDSIVINKNKLRFLANSDTEMFELIHSNTIQRFFPQMTRFAFSQYLTNESELESKVKHYAFDKEDLKRKYAKQAILFPTLDNQRRVTVESVDVLTASTTHITLAYLNAFPTIDTLRLFQMMNIVQNTQLAWVDLYRFDNNQRALRLRKMQQRDQYRRNTNILIAPPVDPKELMYNKCIVFYYLPTSEYTDLIIVVNQNGSIWIKAKPNQSLTFSKAAFINHISPTVNALIETINKQDDVFLVQSKLPLLSSKQNNVFQILASSTNLTFKVSVAYTKLINLVIEKMLDAGIIEATAVSGNKIGRGITVFKIHYGITQATEEEASVVSASEIEIKNVNDTAVIGLSNLDVSETNLYVDLIGRLILSAGSLIQLQSTNQSELGLIDPVLFRPRIMSDGYSRICQKKFQPVITTKDDKKAVEYFNFTFNKPEFYKCPSKDNPVLGFIQGRHESGYCLPCCRKTAQADPEEVRKQCISNESSLEEKQSSYKIDYPIHSIPNHKIMNRRMKLLDYVIQLFGGQSLVANGTIMASHGEIRDGIKPDVKSYLQSATILAAIDNGKDRPMYKSFRELIIDLIELIKQPDMHMQIMKNRLISSRFTSPIDLVHLLEDYYLKQTMVLDQCSKLSAMELNDLIIFLCNCKNMNILLLSDDRQSDIKILNIADIDTDRPTVVIIRRLNVEWSNHHQNTRALYLPITSNNYKVSYKSPLVIPRINIISSLQKIKRITIGKQSKEMSKQLTISNIQSLCSNSKSYKLLEDVSDQKLAIVGINKKTMITTISSPFTTTKIQKLKHTATCGLDDVLTFITDYNLNIVNTSEEISKVALEGYKQYLQVAFKTDARYHLLSGNQFFLKIQKLICVKENIIGAIINVVESESIIATELCFFAHMPIHAPKTKKEIDRVCSIQSNLRKLMNAKSILASPTDQSMTDPSKAIAHWDVNPLEVLHNNKCSKDLKASYNEGMYLNEIYSIMAVDIINAWKQIRSTDIEDYLIKFVKKNTLPIVETRIDTLIEDAPFTNIDKNVFRSTILHMFNQINTFDKTTEQAIARIKSDEVFNGYELKMLQCWTKAEVVAQVDKISKPLLIKSDTYPDLDLELPIPDQRHKFYKSNKLIIHKNIYDDIISFFVSDLCNPFRKDYIINLQLTMTALEDIRPHIGELIFVQQLTKP
jgi:hypothetical protein